MTKHTLLTRTIRRALCANAAAASVGLPTFGIAQTAPPPADQPEAAAPIAEVVTTGSRIVNPAFTPPGVMRACRAGRRHVSIHTWLVRRVKGTSTAGCAGIAEGRMS